MNIIFLSVNFKTAGYPDSLQNLSGIKKKIQSVQLFSRISITLLAISVTIASTIQIIDPSIA